jgi:hypothetical protein
MHPRPMCILPLNLPPSQRDGGKPRPLKIHALIHAWNPKSQTLPPLAHADVERCLYRECQAFPQSEELISYTTTTWFALVPLLSLCFARNRHVSTARNPNCHLCVFRPLCLTAILHNTFIVSAGKVSFVSAHQADIIYTIQKGDLFSIGCFQPIPISVLPGRYPRHYWYQLA